jgi:Big-like domain-containing protein
MSRRLTLLLVGAAMAVLMVVAMAGTALAAPGTPTVVKTYPADKQTGVPLNHIIGVEFSEEMSSASINENTLRLYEGRFSRGQLKQGTPPPPVAADVEPQSWLCGREESVWCDIPAAKTAFLVPQPDTPHGWLLSLTTYTVVVEGAKDSDGRAVEDSDGNPLARDYIFHFTTGDWVDFRRMG